MLEKLTDTDRLQESVDKQIANTELAIVLAFLVLGGLLVVSAIVLPAISDMTSDNDKSA